MKTMMGRAETDSYFRLVRDFPLRPLRREADLEAANRVALKLVASKLEKEMDAGERDYLDALSVLIQDAEREMTAALARKVGAVELLKHLMEEKGMNVSDLGRVIGSQSTASLMLAGKRSISKPQMRKLAEHFGMSPAAFMN
jgi:HTH-type transcriptional regulator / antitoxin HigA